MPAKKTSRAAAKPVTKLKKKRVRELTEAEIRGVRGGAKPKNVFADQQAKGR